MNDKYIVKRKRDRVFFHSLGPISEKIDRVFMKIQCVSKNIPDIFSCNFRKHCRIFIIFGKHVTEKVSNQ